jgi:hypothetical protein
MTGTCPICGGPTMSPRTEQALAEAVVASAAWKTHKRECPDCRAERRSEPGCKDGCVLLGPKEGAAAYLEWCMDQDKRPVVRANGEA